VVSVNRSCLTSLILILVAAVGCSPEEEEEQATVRLKNDFNNPEMDFQPPWTICDSAYRDVEFGKLRSGETSNPKKVFPGLDYVLMVAAWDDASCGPEHCLPIASKNEEEAMEGQTRTIAINLPNHQCACPPEGVPPIPKAQYNRILERWPEYDFTPYPERTHNAQCVSEDDSSGAAGAGGAAGTLGGGGGAAGTQ
jgi:hypothetical protein